MSISTRAIAAMMGQKIVVTQRLERTWPEEDTTPITWAPVPVEARVGWIVGMRFLQTGTIEKPHYYDPWGEDNGPGRPYLKQAGKAIPALLVCFWPTTKTIFVPLDGYREWVEGDPEPRPHKVEFVADEAYRQELRKAAEMLPRDAKGRFVPAKWDREAKTYVPRAASPEAQ